MERTIAAISTAYGEAGIGVIRISGEDALLIAKKLTGRSDFAERYMHLCNIEDIDEALVCYMKGPRSYTGEDVVEIQCHASAASLKEILKRVYELGAEPAEPGEFTKRAFLNGRLDLSQAEAVMDLIKARTDRTYQVALDQLEGSFSKGIRAIRADITDILVDMAVNIDYPDEDIE
ncbi:MAG: tRNA uridine-5-carboxymethylaminomethyl(34) synthesis GTPase MnmE, partial [Firmicutes bacterium]|nr:tRNA uridine-5-carboxymethylaminomethyl(34) synthesis GTPase MnmE [Bacillota bacterium]